MSERIKERLRSLPAVDRLAERLRASAANGGAAPTAAEAISAARAVLAERRAELLAGTDGDPDQDAESDRLLARAQAHLRPSLRRVLNGTGVVIHTNLGRAPLAQSAIQAVSREAHGYSNLEIDLDRGTRGSRQAHVRGLLAELTGAQDALVVNNGAAAALLAIAALGNEAGIAVSRGQLVEIGGGFRVPEVLAQAGVPLIEVGTTNRTRIADYQHAIAERGAAAILSVHQSNFRTVGFVEEVPIERLCALGVPVIDDLGSGALIGADFAASAGDSSASHRDSGALADASSVLVSGSKKHADGSSTGSSVLADVIQALAEEPPVRRSVAAGATLVCFSGDKLLGGPQAGILVGGTEAIAACRRHPLARALRIGRLPLAALEATLALYRDPVRAVLEVPVLAMLCVGADTLGARAERLAAACNGMEVEIIDAVARVGGGALPLLELHGPALALRAGDGGPEALAAALRRGDPALVPRIAEGRVLIDPRTLADEEIEPAAAAIRAALETIGTA